MVETGVDTAGVDTTGVDIATAEVGFEAVVRSGAGPATPPAPGPAVLPTEAETTVPALPAPLP